MQFARSARPRTPYSALVSSNDQVRDAVCQRRPADGPQAARDFLSERERLWVQACGVPVDAFKPGRYWIANLDGFSALPTPSELRQLRSLIEFVCSRYAQPRSERLAAMALPEDPGCTTYTLTNRRGGGGWCYQQPAWSEPWPAYGAGEPLSLVAVCDRIFARVDDWQGWKAAHAGVFSGA